MTDINANFQPLFDSSPFAGHYVQQSKLNIHNEPITDRQIRHARRFGPAVKGRSLRRQL